MPITQILVVDDFLPWLRMVRAIFESRENLHVIAEAVDGLDAVQKAQQLQPDLIVLDIGLPLLNGIEAARQIRQLSPNSKILFASTEASVEVVEEAFRLGAQGYLLKVDVASELLRAVDVMILRGELFVSRGLRSHLLSRGGPSPDKVQKYAEFQKPRAMNWEMSLQKVVYTCTHCAWELVVDVGTCPESIQLFEQHDCANHIHTSRVHEVASYRDHESFLDDFARFIDAALKKGNPVIAITTEAHRGGIWRRLEASGCDVAAAVQEGTYISLDANATLSKLMVNDWPDAIRFSEIADNLIRGGGKMAKSEPRIAICGECAPILWAQGKAEAAIQLEKLWDGFARRHDVDILCGYTLIELRRSENSHIFKRICAEHSAAYSV